MQALERFGPSPFTRKTRRDGQRPLERIGQIGLDPTNPLTDSPNKLALLFDGTFLVARCPLEELANLRLDLVQQPPETRWDSASGYAEDAVCHFTGRDVGEY